MRHPSRIVMLALVVTSCVAVLLAQSTQPAASQPKPDRAKGQTLQKQGNWKEAYAIFSVLATDPATEADKVADDLAAGVECLRRLGQIQDFDGFVEKSVAAHAKNWRLLERAAQSYMNVDHSGFIIAGAFRRGPHRGGDGKYVSPYERDRVRALQLMQQAIPAVQAESNKAEAGQFWWRLAEMLLANRGFYEAWRLQYLTDLSTLPDYEEGYYYYGSSGKGAPVDEEGKPVFHHLPKSWQEATSDGQRWRWALMQAMETNPALSGQVRHHFASFLHHQFGVQTMAEYGWFFGRYSEADETRKDESGTYAVHTLGEDETIAKLANGIKRFKLPDEFNFIKIFKDLSDSQHKTQAESSLGMLASIFQDRRQYPKAPPYLSRSIKDFGDPRGAKQQQIDQIVNPWGMFERIGTQPAGQGASVEYRFRNGKKVSFEAHELDVKTLLADVKEYLKGAPQQLDWNKVNLENYGWRLVEQNQQKYVKAKAAAWELELKPRPNHWDARVTVATPLQKSGAYWLVGKMDNGNTSRIVLWVADTAIVQKPLENKSYLFVADAVSGEPVAKANLEFFGYQQKWVQDEPRGGRGHYDVTTRNFAEFTDADGQCILDSKENQGFTWVITATTAEGRFAYHGFTGLWGGGYYDAEYKAVKTYVITDRPVYRPGQAAKFKFWVNHAQYDQEGKSQFAGNSFWVVLNNPKGEKVWEKQFTADEYGGFDGEVPESVLNKEATLGQYYLFVDPQRSPANTGGGGHFRLEEYKKPEFEVKVDAPDEPVMLGEKFTAKVQAKYYFGAPVVNAKAKYKVTRTSHDSRWYPLARWDWFYGKGYWWFAYDYVWYPGWAEWGCWRPIPFWWWQRPAPPEIVAEGDAQIDKDGNIKIEIDTKLAKELHGDQDHKYDISVEVTDQSRRTIVGAGSVLVARKPFKVYSWCHRGYYRVGDVIQANFCAQTLARKPVSGKGELKLFRVTYKDAKPVEEEVGKWLLPTDVEGKAAQQIKPSQAGQYRLSYKVADAKGHSIEGGYVLVIMGQGKDNSEFRFNDIELVTDRGEYKADEKVQLLINTNRAKSTVLLFVRASSGAYLPPKVLRLKGKSDTQTIELSKKDMPNFFIEGLTVSGAKVFTEVREVIVPPESRILNVEVKPSAERYKPGEKATVKLKLTDDKGEPFVGSTVLAMYDKAVEYVSGGSNVSDIKEFFWKWRRHHRPQTQSSLDRYSWNYIKSGEIGMSFLGVFGASVVEELADAEGEQMGGFGGGGRSERRLQAAAQPGAPMAARGAALAEKAGTADGISANAAYADRAGVELAKRAEDKDASSLRQREAGPGGAGGEEAMAEATVRTNFADTALWQGSLTTAKDGTAQVELTMPENLTTWKTRTWAMGNGTRVGEASAEVITTKNLLIRLQAPRFFVQKDEVVLSANVHNYLKDKKQAKVVLELEGDCLAPMDSAKAQVVKPSVTKPATAPAAKVLALTTTIEIDANGEQRVDWRVKVAQPGEAVIRMKALTNEESDAMEMRFPVYVHGMLKTESFSGGIRPDKDSAFLTIKVPAERRPEESRLEIRYSPTLAMAMVDALPYLVHYPYGMTECTLNRFVPTVLTQKVLLNMGLDLKEIKNKRTNLNAQEIGDDAKRATDWQRMRKSMLIQGLDYDPVNPVFDEDVVRDMVKKGVNRLASMQCGDGGWGWFSGWGERSWPHTTAVVVHGLQVAKANDVALIPGMLEKGVDWLKRYQAEQLQRLQNAMKSPKVLPFKDKADDIDALVFMVLVDADANSPQMLEFLYRDRNDLSVYAKAMLGLACHKIKDNDKRDMFKRNVEQFLKQDDENQTAWLDIPGGWSWWCWHGSEYEAQAFYLKLLVAVEPNSPVAPRMVKYLLNNRRHATYWNSTRDTAYVVEAFADYIKATGEDKPDMTVTLSLDGKQAKQVKIDAKNLFAFDNKLVLEGEAVTTGQHRIDFAKAGTGPLYFNAYLTNFTLEDPIAKAGLEIKVERKYYKLTAVDKKIKVEGVRGQALDQKVEKYERKELKNLDLLKSGDLVEIELVIDSKNDYEYILFEDMKPAGLETVLLRSGYGQNEMGAYMELRDERVCFFVRALARGQHSLSYRMRAEIPGMFSALPTRAGGVYAPELKANSDEIKVKIED